MKKLLVLVGILFVGLLAGCGSDSDEDVTVVRVGVVGAFQDHWEKVNELLEQENIRVELVTFSDFATPNTALNDGELDLNAFQNYGFFDNAIETNGYDLVSLGDTFVTPLNIFVHENRISDVSELQAGDEIGIPSDLTNGGRALKFLESAGLIVMEPAVGYLGTEADIIENPSGIEIVTAESGILASMLPDLAAAIINAPNAITGGLDPETDSILQEDAFGTEIADDLVNLIASRSEDADNPVFKKIVKAYQTEEVRKVIIDVFQGALIPVW